MKGYIYSEQIPMFGHKDIIGYGTNEFCVKEIDRDLANKTIIKNHYSKKVYNATYINLGVFINDEFLGVLQYGYAMNPASAGSVVTGTEMNQYLELNRMWLDDKAKRNSESMAISYSIKYIKGKLKTIKWIQSFADERCGGLGIVYQAANFNYYGLHVSTFWEIDGEVYHNSIVTNGKRKAKAKLESKLKDAKKMELRQFRYIYFINKKEIKNCLLEQQKYLKHYNND